MIDSSNLFNEKKKFPIISSLKANSDSSISKIFLDDFFIFLSFLGISDGVLHDNEVTFMNYIFNSNWTKIDLVPMIDAALKNDVRGLPLSFMILHELDEFKKKDGNSNFEQTELLFIDYEMMGKLFIAVDGNIDRSELNAFNKYISNLRENLNKFKLIGYRAFVRSFNSEDNGMDGNNFGFTSTPSSTNNQKRPPYEKDEENEEELLDKGIKQLEYGNYQDAEDALKKVVKINPENALAWSTLCVLYRNIDNKLRALNSINRAIEIEHDNAQYWFNKGDTLFWSGDFKESIKCFDKAIELDPNECDDALAIKAMALIKLNKRKEANGCLIKSLRNNPKNKLALEAIKNTDAIDVEIKKIDTELASKIDVSPKTCARMRVAPSYIHALNKKGIDILFNFSAFSKSKLTHGSKIYYFDKDEVDGAFAYISDVWWEEFMEDEFGHYGG